MVLPGERIAPKPGDPGVPVRPPSLGAAREVPSAPVTAPVTARTPTGQPAMTPDVPTPSTEAPRSTGQTGQSGPINGALPPSNGCTAPQLRRFIKSRPYVPMHELRRRFGIAGTDDDVTQVRLERQAIYVGLPEREGALLGELLRGGEIGCELSLDPRTPVVIGVYPMRPVPRS